MRVRVGFVVMLVLALIPTPATAQTVSEVLSFLLTNRAVQTDDFQRDAAAAAATRDTVTTMLGAELATLPPTWRRPASPTGSTRCSARPSAPA